ncbi:MAG: hypothetical protein WC297_03410, partial [Candidatus Paceibacterota bacterium]
GSWELTALFETTNYQTKYATSDNGTSTVLYEVGNHLKITPDAIASRTNTTGGGETTQYTLTTSKTGDGTGTVTSNPSGINCGSTCSYDFDDNTEVTLTAEATEGSTFTAWSGEGCSGTGTCVVTMSEAMGVTANFDVEASPEPHYFTTSGTWQAPAGVTSVKIECYGAGGAGGAGGSASLNYTGGGGGGGGAYSKINSYNVTPGNSYSFTVGAKGTKVSSNDGNPGGDTVFNVDVCVAKGGAGGKKGASPEGVGGAGGSSGSGVGDVKYSGGTGGTGNMGGGGGGGGSSAGTGSNGNNGTVTSGGAAPEGGYTGGNGVAMGNASDNSSTNYGGAGGGAGAGPTLGSAGDGAGGLIILTY